MWGNTVGMEQGSGEVEKGNGCKGEREGMNKEVGKGVSK